MRRLRQLLLNEPGFWHLHRNKLNDFNPINRCNLVQGRKPGVELGSLLNSLIIFVRNSGNFRERLLRQVMPLAELSKPFFKPLNGLFPHNRGKISASPLT